MIRFVLVILLSSILMACGSGDLSENTAKNAMARTKVTKSIPRSAKDVKIIDGYDDVNSTNAWITFTMEFDGKNYRFLHHYFEGPGSQYSESTVRLDEIQNEMIR